MSEDMNQMRRAKMKRKKKMLEESRNKRMIQRKNIKKKERNGRKGCPLRRTLWQCREMNSELPPASQNALNGCI